MIIRHTKLLIIDKQLLHATQLLVVVWNKSSHYLTYLNRLPTVRQSVVKTDTGQDPKYSKSIYTTLKICFTCVCKTI